MTKHLDAAELAAPYDAGRAEGERIAAQQVTLHDAAEAKRYADAAVARHEAVAAESLRRNGLAR